MAKYDELDIALQRIDSNEDLAKLCEIGNLFKDYYEIFAIREGLNNKPNIELLNEKIRSNYRNVVTDVLSNAYEPDYSEILIDTAKFFEIKTIPEKVEDKYDIECLEKEILINLCERIKNNIIKECGFRIWRDIEESLIKNFYSNKTEENLLFENIRNILNKDIIAALKNIQLSDFEFYLLVNKFLSVLGDVLKYNSWGLIRKIITDMHFSVSIPLPIPRTDVLGLPFSIYTIESRRYKGVLCIVFIILMRMKRKYYK